MSWNITLVGTPDKIVKVLETYGEGLNGLSQEEFGNAQPHLSALVSQNKNESGNPPAIRLTGSGHSYSNPEGKVSASFQCSIENLGQALI